MKHSAIQNLLYDFVQNELNESDRKTVEQHLSSCTRCSNELSELRKTLAILPRPASQPEEIRDEAFWQSLAVNIEREIRLQRVPKRDRVTSFIEQVRSFFALRPAYAFSAGAALAGIVAAVILFRPQDESSMLVTEKNTLPEETLMMPTASESQQRISDYFRKSKVLLVGLANLKTEDEQNIDLSNERTVSRSLVHEARFLQQQPLDGRSARLIRDLEKIMIELANLEETTDLPNVELIRSGIRQENLLFKIRMAAASYDTNQTSQSGRIY
ncbi:MAG: zf-HC2 domain-containing protein [Bacteroidetes bacterium]|nr:zf-HC2 domain-containing protein [Bacteroidota bacterium]MCW5895746.1 zf-HC2 domain-containing protein [Bacteroidota bacterium]